jgi:hypothetical protein
MGAKRVILSTRLEAALIDFGGMWHAYAAEQAISPAEAGWR